jgi:ech hydrogenase subunit D
MIEEQKIIDIQIPQLLGEVQKCKGAGYRLVQICATTTPAGYELSYSFDKDYQFINYRIVLATNAVEIPSVSSVYWNAFLYENELHDLFGFKITGIAIDYKGDFYKTTVKFPFEKKKSEEKKVTE